MRKLFKIFTIVSLIWFLPHTSVHAKEVKFETNLDRSKIALGETSQLGLSFYQAQSMPAPDPGNIDGLEIRYVGPSTMMTVINGQVSSSITHMYTILPLRVGKFQIGPFSFKYKGNDYTSNMIFLEVTEERAPPEPKESEPVVERLNLDDRIFLTLEVGKNTSYVNELIPVTVKLFVNRLNVNDIQLPTFEQEGFSKIEFREPKQYRDRQGGIVYEVLEFNTKIFGTRPGDYRLGPAKIKCNIMVRKRVSAGMRDDMFGDDRYRDSFFEDFFTRYERYPVELKSQDTQIIVSPLPIESRPPDFTGAVGDYQFIYSASPKGVKTGDPVTVKMSINGNGNFNTVLIPKLDSVDGFRMYESQVNTDEHSKTFTQVLIPESEKITHIPGATFTYFDPVRKRYLNITQGPIPIKVEKSKEEAPSRVVGPAQSNVIPAREDEFTRDIIYIKESPSRWIGSGFMIYRNRFFVAIAPLPVLFLLALYIVQKRRNRLRSDAAYAGRVNASRVSKESLKRLERNLKNGDTKVFYEALFDALQHYIGHRLHLPPAGITSDIVDGALMSRGVDMEVLGKIRRLFEICDQARFAHYDITELSMRDNLKEFSEIVSFLERKKL